MKTVAHVDLDRFMGDWYVVAHIPAFIEKNAHNAVESYRLTDDGSIETTYTFLNGGFDGKRKTYHPRGFVVDDGSNAEWRMQFLWPFKSEYLIVDLNDDYTSTIIGRSKRDYVWVMTRSPDVPEQEFRRLREVVVQQGYDFSRLRLVPHQWPDDAGARD